MGPPIRIRLSILPLLGACVFVTRLVEFYVTYTNTVIGHILWLPLSTIGTIIGGYLSSLVRSTRKAKWSLKSKAIEADESKQVFQPKNRDRPEIPNVPKRPKVDARELASIWSSHENALHLKALKSLWDTFTSFGDQAERSKEYMALPPRLQKEANDITPGTGPSIRITRLSMLPLSWACVFVTRIC